MKTKIKILLSFIIIITLIAGGYVLNMFGVFSKGNYGEYNTEKAEAVSSPINGKTIIFLGSSVTYGYGSFEIGRAHV